MVAVAAAVRTTEPAERAVPSPTRPYTGDSPWNTPIAEGAAIHPDSDRMVARIGGPLTSDPTQYTMAVYEAGSETPRVPVRLSGTFSHVADAERAPRLLFHHGGSSLEVAIPEAAQPAVGTDGHLVVVEHTGAEWGFWQARRADDGTWRATNGYRYHIGGDGVAPPGFGSRGAGLPYLAGLIRPEAIDAGEIRHAIAFGYQRPSPEWVHPATKSDGQGEPGSDIPQGARLQLDPSLTEADFERWGLDEVGRIVARALQVYGMVVVDTSGRAKVYFEAEESARWGGRVTEDTVSPIPIEAFSVLDFEVAGTAG